MKKYQELSRKEKAQYISVLILYPFLLLFGWMGETMKLFGTRKRQIIASVLSFTFILTMLPVSVMAAGAGYSYDSSTNELTITTSAGTTAWQSDSAGLKATVQSIVVTDVVASIGMNAFYDCPELTGVVIGKNVTSIDNNAFTSAPKLNTLTVAAGSTSYKVIDNVLFTADGKKLVKYPEGKTGASYTVPAGVEVIDSRSFYQNANLTNVSMADSVKTIEHTAFGSCKKLTTIYLGTCLQTIGTVAFASCWALSDIVFPSTLASIGDSAFSGCFTLVSVTIPAGVTSIGGYAFSNCSALKSVIMESSSAPTLGTNPFPSSISCVVYTPAASTGYDATGWPSGRVLQGRAGLSALSLSGGVTLTPTFSPGVTSYTASAANGVSSLTVTPAIGLGDSITVNGAAVTSGSASGAITLNEGANTITVVVSNSAYPAETQTYTITVTRASAPVVNYNIWVGTTQVTSVNKNNITAPGVTGTVTYNADTNTLTLNNVTVPASANRTIDGVGKYGIYSNQSLNLVINGINTITAASAADMGSTAIRVNGSLTISSGGSLTAIGGSVSGTENYGSFGIVADQLTVDSGVVTTKGGSVPFNLSFGIYSLNAVTVNGGTITAAGNDRAIGLYAPDLDGYANVKVKASVNTSGTPTADYIPANISIYKYLSIQPGASISFMENFDDITTLAASGWTMKNNSAPVGAYSWFQGNPPSGGPFESYNGAANSYIAANFNSTGSTGTISNWLISPQLFLTNGSTLTFYTRKAAGDTDYPDRLEVRMSGSGVNPGTGATDTGDFTTLLLSVNPSLAQNVYPTQWTKYTATVSGLTEPTDGYLAFRYYVTSAGSLGSNSDYIGIDAVSYKAKGEQAALSFETGTPTVKTYGDIAFSISATGGSGTGAVSYSVVSGPATISGNTVTLTSAGSVVLRATKASDDDYIEKSVETTITVSKKPVTITGVKAASKIYDGNKAATVSGTVAVSGKVGSDDVSVSAGTAAFADKTVGNDKTVTFTGFTLSGDDAGKYTLSAQPSNVTANITAKPITMNVSVYSKAYDGLNTAVISGASLNGIESGDTVNLVAPYPTATFTSVSAASNIAVSFSDSFELTGTDAGNYILTQPSGITAFITNRYNAVKDTDYTVNQTGWSKTDFVITAKAGFELSFTNTADGVWRNLLTKSDETASGKIIFYVRNKATGAISLEVSESYQIDKTAPDGDVKKGVSSIKKALNTITFGFFFKGTQTISITSADTGSGVASVSYKLSSAILDETAVEEISDWTAYTGAFTIQPNSKTVVYVKVTDVAGNVTYLGSEGVVLFSDSTANTASVSFSKKSTADVTATVNLNGNTIKDVRVGGKWLVENTDYTVDGETITLKATYLDTLAAGNYTVLIGFHPLGENAEFGLGSAPNNVSIPLTISKAVPALSVTVSPTGSQTRPNSVTLSARLPVGAAGMLQFTANGINIGAPVAVGQTVTFTASGPFNDYAFMVFYSGDTDYAPADACAPPYSFVKGEQAALSFAEGTPTAKTYGDAAFTVSATGGSGTGAISYAVVSGPATISSSTVTLTGVGSVVLRATKEADDDYNVKSVDTTITVGKKAVTITGVTAQSKVYDGNKAATVSGTAEINGKVDGDMVSVSGGSAVFADKVVSNGKTVTFTGFTLSGADAGKYTLSAQPANVTANITAKAITMNVTILNKAYDGLNTAMIASTALNGVVSGDVVNIATPYPAATFASVGAATSIPVSFAGNFTLLGADAGNYTLTQPSGITGNITNSYNALKDTDYTVGHTDWSNTDFVVTAKAGFELSLTNTVGGVWSDSLTGSDETATGSLTFYVRNKTTGAISLVASENYQTDKTAPTGDIKIGESSIKKALNAITFGLFFKDTQSITITSADTGSGVASVSYKLSSTVLDETDIEQISDWTTYTDVFTVEPDSQTVVYVKITDAAGNILYLGSDGLVLDSTSPVISGIENDKVYCAAVTVTVTDANLDTVTVDGTAAILTDGKLTLSLTGIAQTIVATDKSGNSTSVTVTVYDGHAWDEGVVTVAPTASKKGVKTYTCTHCGEIKTEEIAMLVPEITEGKNGLWKQGESRTLTFRSDAAFSDFINVLIDGKVIDAKYYDLKEGSIIVTLKADYLTILPAGTHTLGIQSTTGTASTEFTVTAKTDDKAPSKPDEKIPQTGDNSNMLLWFALLFVSGGSLFATSMTRKRKKQINA